MSKPVEWTHHAARPALEHVRVDHGRGDVPVPQQLLDGADLGAGFEEVGREAVAQGVAARPLGQPRGEDGRADLLLDVVLINMVAAPHRRRAGPGSWVEAE